MLDTFFLSVGDVPCQNAGNKQYCSSGVSYLNVPPLYRKGSIRLHHIENETLVCRFKLQFSNDCFHVSAVVSRSVLSMT